MLVAMSLLVMIVLGLTMMFMQTQKAFKGGLRQVDIFESGRAAMNLIARDLESVSDAGKYSDAGSNILNLMFKESGNTRLAQYENGVPFRTNYIYELYCLSRIGSQWIASGYVVTNLSTNGLSTNGLQIVGTLYKYTGNRYCTLEDPVAARTDGVTNTVNGLRDNTLYTNFSKACLNPEVEAYRFTNNFTRVADGVVHFKIRAVGGDALEWTNNAWFPCTNITLVNSVYVTNRIGIPNAVEVELGILEPETFQQAASMPEATAQAFLQGRASKVHIFRQQIPIRASSR
jgi:hypothetical protein